MLAKFCKHTTVTDDTAQSKGGIARAQSLTKDELKSIARNAAKARWLAVRDAAKAAEDPNRIPDSLCQGDLVIGAVNIECYVLDNLKRVIHKRGMAKGLGMKSGGGNVFLRAMGRKGLGSVISEELRHKIDNPIIFKALTGDLGHGYDCTVLIDICNAIIDAQKANKLGPNQERLAIQA